MNLIFLNTNIMYNICLRVFFQAIQQYCTLSGTSNVCFENLTFFMHVTKSIILYFAIIFPSPFDSCQNPEV
jgi:hypothetical protein